MEEIDLDACQGAADAITARIRARRRDPRGDREILATLCVLCRERGPVHVLATYLLLPERFADIHGVFRGMAGWDDAALRRFQAGSSLEKFSAAELRDLCRGIADAADRPDAQRQLLAVLARLDERSS